MTGEVIDLAAARQAREPHITGPCVCLDCGHEWEGVSPVGVSVFDCPACGLTKGVRKGLCVWHDQQHWTCGCGNQFFHLTVAGAYCPCCGNSWAPEDVFAP